MALKASIFKVALNVADTDRQVYEDFALTIARHPSETDERMLLRVIAFAFHAGERLEFGRGISTDDEPDLWQKTLAGDIELWIDLGTPDESRLRKACGRADQVVLYCYGGRSVPIWWDKNGGQLARHRNLTVLEIEAEASAQLAALVAQSMRLQVTISDGEAFISADHSSADPVRLALTHLQDAASR